MTYILENKDEGERLEFQSKLKNYSIENELRNIRFASDDVVLDVGCGAGTLCRHVAASFDVAQVDGCDGSEIRIQQAKKMSPKGNRVAFFSDDIYQSKIDSNRYTKVFCRFVLQHLDKPDLACSQLQRILKPGGTVCVIESDGLIFDLFTRNKDLKSQMSRVKKELGVNTYMGREVPSLLQDAGFKEIQWEIQPMPFQGEELQAEYQNNVQRFAFIRPKIVEILGSAEKADSFIALYLKEMLVPQNVLFCNKFIVTARK